MSRERGRSAAHVLVVDSEQDVLCELGNALKSLGYSVSTARSGNDALEIAREQRLDLTISDLCLEGMSGIQLAKAFCRMHPQVPVVLMTTYGDAEAGRLALEAGVSDFITKPVDIEALPFIVENNIQRKKLEAQRLSEQRADVLFKAIKALAAAIDARSDYNGPRSARLADLCIAVGTELGLPKDGLNALELAAYIHDIGKIDTPNSVLTKQGKLSGDEWVDVVKHPGTGAGFLAGIEELSEVAAIVRHHHERFDGGGYPDGLMEDAIPFSARILSAADAYVAMTSRRPYRDALSPEEALLELRKNAGTQFDPAVVAAVSTVIQRSIGSSDERKAA